MVRGAIFLSAVICLVQAGWIPSAHAENRLTRMKNAAMQKVSAAQHRITAPVTNVTRKNTGAAREIRDKWAVFIGVGQFQDHAVTPLKFAFKNTSALIDVFKNVGVGRFAPDHVLTIANAAASKDAIEKTLTDEWLCKKALPEDLVVIYICTRFIPINGGEDAALFAHDTRLENAAVDGIALSELLANVKRRLQSKRVLALLDLSPVPAEEAGNAGLNVEKIAQKSGISILSATKGAQQSQNSAAGPISSFTQYFAEGLNSSMGTLPLAAIAEYVVDSVSKDARNIHNKEQTPLFIAAADSPDITEVPLGVRLKSSIPEKTVSIGHPVDQLGMHRPDIIAGTPGRSSRARTLIASANIPGADLSVGQGSAPAAKQAKTAVDAKPAPAAGSAAKPPAKAAKEADDDEDEGDPQNVDMTPYVAEMKRLIQTKWTPPKGMEEKRVVTVFTIRRNGNLEEPTVVESSGTESVDQSALAALKAASPLPPLPKGSPQFIQIRYKFDWKVKPSSK
ncbi:MAG: TonB family protein [Candidatus Melainabacteria bacterium]|nr:TonB family protein [Candidatus Melainabacteria bacterium]